MAWYKSGGLGVEDGNNVEYPVAVPSFGNKLYREKDIQDIAVALGRDVTVSEMADTIESMGFGVNLETFIANNLANNARIAGFTNPLTIHFINTKDKYSIFILMNSDYVFKFGLDTLSARGVINPLLEISNPNGIRCNLTSDFAINGRDNFVPFELIEYQNSWTNLVKTDYDYDLSNLPFYNKRSKIKGLVQANTHPVIYDFFGDEEYHVFSDMVNNLTFKDFINFTIPYSVQDLTGLMYINNLSSSWFRNYWVAIPNSSECRYDTANGKFIFGASSGSNTNGYVKYTPEINATKNDVNLSSIDNGLWQTTITPENLATKVLFNTMDIKDENNNVILAANCTLADLGIT